MAAVNYWLSQQASYERPKWRSQRPATPPSFTLRTPDDRDLDAVTWTRATTKSVTDYQGNVHQALSGEVTWEGYRRVRNHVIAPEDLDNGTYWSTASNVTVAAGGMTVPAGYGATAHTITEAATTASHRIKAVSSITGAANQTYILSAVIKRPTGDTRYAGLWLTNIAGTSQLRARIDPDTGTVYTEAQGNAVVDASGSEDLDGGIWRFWVVGRADTTAGDAAFYLAIVKSDGTLSYAGDTGEAMVFAAPQLELARPGQTAPDEYVSNGVLSTPYHGAFVDGVRYFDTDENGARIDGTRGYRRIDNLCTYSDSSFGSWYTRTGLETNSTTLIPSTSNSPHYLGTPSLPPANSSTWLKFLFRSSGATWLRIGHGGHTISVNSVTGAVGATSGSGTTTVTGPDDDGFYTLIDKVSAHSSAAGVYFSVNNVDSTTTQTYTGDGVSGIEIRYAQLSTVEGAESEPPAYIQTAASAVSQWVASSDVTPIPPGLVIGSAQTNRITYSSGLTSGWTDSGAGTRTAAYDAQVGVYTQLRSVGASGADDFYFAATGFTGAARTEPAMMLRAVSTSGSLVIENASDATKGKWTVNLASVSTTRFERIDRFHAAVTINTEFVATAGGAAGIRFYVASGSIGFDVSLVTQVEAQRVQSLIYSAGSVTAANADAPSFTWTAFASNNEGAIVLDFVPLAPDATAASYASGAAFVGKSTSAAMTASDGTNSGAWGDQTERTRTKIALAWQAGSGMTGYRDGEEAFADATYDGAWATSTLTLAGPMLLRELSIYPTALTATQLQALSNG